MKRLLSIALLACAVSSALAQEEPALADFNDAVAQASAAATVLADESTALARLETGIASWYGRQFQGRKTASGERFDMDALTAAHPNLPFGSWVRVRNLLNGRSVDVRINDRGPYIKRRIIDLSRAAARALGVSGTYQVELSLLDPRH
jgi:rare lipoprotein A